MTHTFDTNNGTIIEIAVNVDSLKPKNGLNEFEITIKLIQLNSDAVSIFNLEIDYKLGSYFSNTAVFSENLTQTGQTLSSTSTFEYYTVWEEVNLEMRIRFNDHREISGRTTVGDYESDWLFFLSLKPITLLDEYLWLMIAGGSVAFVIAGTGIVLRGRIKGRIKKKRLPKKSKDLFLKFIREASTKKTREYKKTWKEFVVSLHKINPNITSKSVHRLANKLASDLLGNLSQEQILRLLRSMDKKDKIEKMLANVMKEMKSTNESLIRNLK
jgi:hypothetical protein